MGESYHDLSRAERDFLVAVGNTHATATGRECADYVQSLRNGERPGDNTTYRVLPKLVSAGLVHKETGEGRGDHYQLTEQGFEWLHDASRELQP